MPHIIHRINRHCAYFRCHDRLEDCTFCYCPFYPCKDILFGKYIAAKDGSKIWSCEDCDWIHRKKIVDKIFDMIRNSNIKRRTLGGGGAAKGTAVIILGHGSKLKKANDSLYRLAKKIKKESMINIVEPAFLQLCEPGLRKTIEKVVDMGCKKVVIVPFFLFTGNHVSRDIPEIIGREAKMHKGVELVYAKSLGQNPKISDIVMDSIVEASI